MKTNKFIRISRIVVTTAFYVEIVAILMPLFVVFSFSIYNYWQLPKDGSRIIYDTTGTEKTKVFIDLTGKKRSQDSLKKAEELSQKSLPDSIQKKIAAEELKWKIKEKNLIDSILKADPKAVITMQKNGWRASGGGSAFFEILIKNRIYPEFGNRQINDSTLKSINDFTKNIFQEKKLAASWSDKIEISKQAEYNVKIPYAEFQKMPLLFQLRLPIILLYIAMILLITWQLKRLFENFEAFGFFYQKHYKRIQLIGIILCFEPFFSAFWHFLENNEVEKILLANHFQVQGGGALPVDSFFSGILKIAFGLTLIAIAQAFRAGQELKQENDLTI